MGKRILRVWMLAMQTLFREILHRELQGKTVKLHGEIN